MIRADEENEIDFEMEMEASGREREVEGVKITREMLKEQQKILDDLVKKKAEADEIVDITEEPDYGWVVAEGVFIVTGKIVLFNTAIFCGLVDW